MFETVSHSDLMYFVIGNFAALAGLAGFMWKKTDMIRKELEDAMPTKEEVKMINSNLHDISTRLDALYTVLAAHTISLIKNGKPDEK